MARYTVIGQVDASTYADVEADSPEQAIDLAQLSTSRQDIDIGGGVFAFRVLDESGEEVYGDDDERVVCRDRVVCSAGVGCGLPRHRDGQHDRDEQQQHPGRDRGPLAGRRARAALQPGNREDG